MAKAATASFWQDSEFHEKSYTDTPVTPEKVKLVEKQLGFKLPKAYVDLMASQNGGAPLREFHRTKTATSWAEDHVAIHAFFSIGNAKDYSLCGKKGSKFWVENWEYPALGIYIADCPSAGHDMIALDYRKCGPNGEPTVVHVDQEDDFKVTVLAKTFADFLPGLLTDEELEDSTDNEEDHEAEDAEEVEAPPPPPKKKAAAAPKKAAAAKMPTPAKKPAPAKKKTTRKK